MAKPKEIYAMIGFGISIAALTTGMIPALSMLLVVIGLIFTLLGKDCMHKGMFWAALGMQALALIINLIYLLVVLKGRA